MKDRVFHSSVYYHPEQCGLRLVAIFDVREPDYSFDLVAVWEDVSPLAKLGTFYYAYSSGCSCPTPFEEYESISSLETLSYHRLDEFFLEVDNRRQTSITLFTDFKNSVKKAFEPYIEDGSELIHPKKRVRKVHKIG